MKASPKVNVEIEHLILVKINSDLEAYFIVGVSLLGRNIILISNI